MNKKILIPSTTDRALVLEALFAHGEFGLTKCGSPTCCYTSCTRC